MDQFVLPDNELPDKEQKETEELPIISQWVQDIIEVLNNFKELGDHERWLDVCKKNYITNFSWFF